jgi:subtilisin-like proprotein convertase family protein
MNLPSRTLCLVASLAFLLVQSPVANSQTVSCVVGAANGGAIPASGTGGQGTYPTTLAPAPSLFGLAVSSLPAGASVVTEVKLIGLTHSWITDCQFVLEDPSGALHNLLVRPSSSAGAALNCDFSGTYSIVAPGSPTALELPEGCGNTQIVTPGPYAQNFGSGPFAWPSGTSGISNTPLDSIQAATGVWTLRVYDWASGDLGFLTSFDICFGAPGSATAPTEAPLLIAPTNGATLTNPITLVWSALADATAYAVDVDGTTSIVTSTSIDLGPQSVGLHTWTVRGINAVGSGPAAAPYAFNVASTSSFVCAPNGSGAGLVPPIGTGGGGTWPDVLPPNPYTSTYLATPPQGSTRIASVELTFAQQHTWAGDLFFVLTDPTGGRHNLLHRLGSNGQSVGLNCDFDGSYSIVSNTGVAWPTVCAVSGDIPVGSYDQSFGAWPNGSNGIFNTPLESIPVSGGDWNLSIYDWAGGDVGVIGDWKLCFDVTPSTPTAYCTAGTTTNGCNASIGATSNPSISLAVPCVLSVANVEGQKLGILFYGIDNAGFTPIPWGAGSSYQCVKAPLQRTSPQNPLGSSNACNGVLTLDWDAWQLANPTAQGNPWNVGDKVYIQAWFRDPPAPKSSNLSNALELTYQP